MKTLYLLFSLLSNAAINQAEVKDITINHTVESGETLHSITRKYLGSDFLWQENWKLNPHIENPHLLTIGDELTIIQERIIPAEKARVLETVNRVEKKPVTSEWKVTAAGDELIQQEGVRTYEQSSALLAFNDQSTLKVLEFSQIFLKNRSTTLRGTDSATIEIIKGDTELKWEPLNTQATDITIMLGSTASKPALGQGKTTALRTGLTDAGDSVISVFQGQSAVESAGTAVQVPQGMGVAVKQGQAPPKPEPLLPAPSLAPDTATEYSYTNPIIKWQPVNGASDYVVELCADETCQIISSVFKTTDAHWQDSQARTAGIHYFRVAARTAQKLVGYHSKPHKLVFSSDQMDQVGPLVAVHLSGPQMLKQSQLTVGPSAMISIHAIDLLSGLAQIEYRWNNESWETYQNEPISLVGQSGTFYVRAIDRLGHQTLHDYQIVKTSALAER